MVGAYRVSLTRLCRVRPTRYSALLIRIAGSSWMGSADGGAGLTSRAQASYLGVALRETSSERYMCLLGPHSDEED